MIFVGQSKAIASVFGPSDAPMSKESFEGRLVFNSDAQLPPHSLLIGLKFI